ncbi:MULTISPECIES: sigma factor-binding protein Crl [unclassified Agarivorans]|uniref:sigma factor-binding protein Crl n=1 Tax=unclassified Agarivorans TaxID=2636026 RepID=UPI003D7D9D7B
MEVTWPSHGKLSSTFTAMGPYYRKEHSVKEQYFFDCLASCVSAKPAAEEREFFGWWLELRLVDSGFEYHYWYGLYDKQGEWQEMSIPQKNLQEVQQSLDVFYQKLVTQLDKFSITLSAAPSLSPNLTLPAA